MKLALICGGPSKERGISLNSARSVLDHLSTLDATIQPIYIDPTLQAHAIDPKQLYSNTPSDFDFKLADIGQPLDSNEFVTLLKQQDITLPLIHGEYGEDGTLQKILEANNIPFVGPSSAACQQMFHKQRVRETLQDMGLPFVPGTAATQATFDAEKIWQNLAAKTVIVKPAASGSSIGVGIASSAHELAKVAAPLFEDFHELVIEPFVEGQEFTVIVMQSHDGTPIALIPTEIEMAKEEEPAIFDYRRKYLPTNATFYHTPARFHATALQKIREQAEQLFTHLQVTDFSRFDGWLLPDGQVAFSDLNPISGAEQNSFVFRQSSRLGMSHGDFLRYIISNACQRNGLPPLQKKPQRDKADKAQVNVLFGGKTAERQVSLMSGTNVWLKLRQSEIMHPSPYLLDKRGDVWQLPYDYTIDHTVEDILRNCAEAPETLKVLAPMIRSIRQQLKLTDNFDPKTNTPQHMRWQDFIDLCHEQDAFVFLGLHGGDGEDGTIQTKLDEAGLLYNGSGPEGSKIGMDKLETGRIVENLQNPALLSSPKMTVDLKNLTTDKAGQIWQDLTQKWGVKHLIIKPAGDGCSAGVLKLHSVGELIDYKALVDSGASTIPPHRFLGQPTEVEMPGPEATFFVEAFLETDGLVADGLNLVHTPRQGWLELTVAVMEQSGTYHSFNPSMVIAEAGVLSLEEKFQGGTGVNITPPPADVFTDAQVATMKTLMEKVAAALKIQNYARIDFFYNRQTDKMIVIEVNTLPGLTGSTVTYHQALAESPPMAPTQFLEHLIQMKQASAQNLAKSA